MRSGIMLFGVIMASVATLFVAIGLYDFGDGQSVTGPILSARRAQSVRVPRAGSATLRVSPQNPSEQCVLVVELQDPPGQRLVKGDIVEELAVLAGLATCTPRFGVTYTQQRDLRRRYTVLILVPSGVREMELRIGQRETVSFVASERTYRQLTVSLPDAEMR